MARNNTPIIIGAALFGVLAVGLTLFLLLAPKGPAGPGQGQGADPNAQATPEPPTSEYYVAARTIYPRTLITRGMLVPREGSAPINAITDPSTVIGRIANRRILVGQAVTTDAVTSPVARVIPANIPIPVGLRGVAVWVDPDETAAGLVDVGDRVDVIATHDLKLEKTGEQAIAGASETTSGRTIAQDVEVLAVDRSIRDYRTETPAPASTPAPAAQPGQPSQPGAGAAPTPTPTPAPGQPGGRPESGAAQPNQKIMTRVILAVSPAEAARLVAANKKGELHITIRNPASRDRLAVSEAREYPAYVYNTNAKARERAAKLADEERARRNARRDRREQFELERERETWKVQPINPSVDIGPRVVPPPAPDKDVTVIRGTEKTRVLVPR